MIDLTKGKTTMKNTSRRNFITGLATGAIAAPVVASTSPSKDETLNEETWDVVKVGMRHAISGYLTGQAYEDMTEEKLKEIELTVSRMFYEVQLRDLIFDHKVIATHTDGILKVKIGFKKKPGANFTIWDCSMYTREGLEKLHG